MLALFMLGVCLSEFDTDVIGASAYVDLKLPKGFDLLKYLCGFT